MRGSLLVSTAVATLGVLAAVRPAAAQESDARAAVIQEGFLTGNDFRQLDQGRRRAYVMGWSDGLLASALLAAEDEGVDWLRECIRGWTDEQSAAVVDKHLAEHPEQWSEYMNLLVYRSLLTVCPR